MHARVRQKKFNQLLHSRKPRSFERVPRTLTDGTLTEREQNLTERIENGYGTGTEQIWNRYRTDMEQVQNRYRTDTERDRERERVWNGNRTCSVKRSQLALF